MSATRKSTKNPKENFDILLLSEPPKHIGSVNLVPKILNKTLKSFRKLLSFTKIFTMEFQSKSLDSKKILANHLFYLTRPCKMNHVLVHFFKFHARFSNIPTDKKQTTSTHRTYDKKNKAVIYIITVLKILNCLSKIIN